VASVFAWDLWVEGDHLLYADGDLRFFRLPLDGGSPELLLDGGAGRTDPGVAFLYDVTATDFAWVESVNLDGPTTVWRASRPGGTPLQIGSVSARTTTSPERGFSKMALSGDSVILSSILGIADAKGAFVEAAGVDGTGALMASPLCSTCDVAAPTAASW